MPRTIPVVVTSNLRTGSFFDLCDDLDVGLGMNLIMESIGDELRYRDDVAEDHGAMQCGWSWSYSVSVPAIGKV